MNKKGQIGKLFMIFSLIVFGLIYWSGLAGGLGEAMCSSAIDNNTTGIWYWFSCNFNLIVFIVWIIAIIAVGALA